jgi:hypothetical protein
LAVGTYVHLNQITQSLIVKIRTCSIVSTLAEHLTHNP